jgi:hypothetical protein
MMTRARASIGDSLYKWFYLIDEPRFKRLLFLVIYLLFIAAGVFVIARSGSDAARLIGFPALLALACAFLIGGGVGAVAIWPGLWWLEKVAFVPLVGALIIRAALLTEIGITPVAAIIYIIGALLLFGRLMDIWKYDGPPLRTSPVAPHVT